MTDATRTGGDPSNQSAADASPESLQQKAAATAEQIRSTVTEGASSVREWASDQGDVLRDTVQTRPLVSVGLSAGTAFAAGLVLGILLTRR